MRHRYPRWPVAVLVIAISLAPLVSVTRAAQEDAEVYRQNGYLALRDGTKLRYTVIRPGRDGSYPVALIFSPYADGSGPTDDYPVGESSRIARPLLEAGYAVLGVNSRGTGCSEGRWDLFRPAKDGYDVVEWAARQTWSTGHLGMFGFSAPGITQLLTAATRPPHLDAIVPNEVTTDLYRDVAYPGGIANTTFTTFWSAMYRPAINYATLSEGDPECAANIAERGPRDDAQLYAQFREHDSYDSYWKNHSPQPTLGKVDVPVLSCGVWQDDQVGSRAGSHFADKLDPERTWVVLTNGHHGTCDDYVDSPFRSKVVRFFDRFVKGKDNGFERTPRVEIWHETKMVEEQPTPAWITRHRRWPVRTRPLALYFKRDARLGPRPTRRRGSNDYQYPMQSSSTEDGEFTEPYQAHSAWKTYNAEGGSVSFTSRALARDAEIFGAGSVDLWVRSTAADTDFQVTLTEVRPDGQEVYVQRGWLRASHRQLRQSRSTKLRPYHRHAGRAVAPLSPISPTRLRVELNPIGHVFRRGSSIRIYVEAPTGTTGLFGFDYLKDSATNTILYGRGQRSRVVLGFVPGGGSKRPYWECDTVMSQPCRPNIIPVPPGEMRPRG